MKRNKMNDEEHKEYYEAFLNGCHDAIRQAKAEKNRRKVKLFEALAKDLEMIVAFYSSKKPKNKD